MDESKSLYGQRSPAPDCRTFSALSEASPRPPSERDGGRAHGGPSGLLPPLSVDLRDLPHLRPRPRLLRSGLLRPRPPRRPPPRAASPSTQPRRSSGSPGSRARAAPAPPAGPARGGSRFHRSGLLRQSAGLDQGGPLACFVLDASLVSCGRDPALCRLSPAAALHNARAQVPPQARARPRGSPRVGPLVISEAQRAEIRRLFYAEHWRIGRPYPSPPERVRARPPFKPCVRISRTRLTDGLRGAACAG